MYKTDFSLRTHCLECSLYVVFSLCLAFSKLFQQSNVSEDPKLHPMKIVAYVVMTTCKHGL